MRNGEKTIPLAGTLVLLVLTLSWFSTRAASPDREDGTALVSIEDITVVPVAREDTTALVDGGVIETDGYSAMILSLAGGIERDAASRGDIGAILIPDLHPFDMVFKREAVFPHPIEIRAAVGPDGSDFFMSEPQAALIAFPRYRVLFYNTTATEAKVFLHAYRTR